MMSGLVSEPNSFHLTDFLDRVEYNCGGIFMPSIYKSTIHRKNQYQTNVAILKYVIGGM